MASAAIWLEKLGVPPREVCLDWAWQIRTHFATAGCSPVLPTTKLEWQRIEVGESGELLFPSDLQAYSPTERLRELLSWADGKLFKLDGSIVQSDRESDLDSELRKLTDQCLRGLTHQTIKSDSKSQIESPPFEDPSLPVVTTPLRSRAKVGVAKSNITDRVIVLLRQHKLAVSLASLLLVAGCFFALKNGTSKAAPYYPGEKYAVETSRQTEARRGDDAATSDSSESFDSESLATVPQIPQLEAVESATPETPRITMPSISSTLSSGVGEPAIASSTVIGEAESSGLISPESSETSESMLGKTAIDEPLRGADPAPYNETGAKSLAEVTNQDVLQELDALTKSAEKTTSESDMQVSNLEDANPVSEALVLRTYPMIQNQKLATKMKVRARQPIWQLQLSVDDEFELTPAEPQDISDRQITTWLLADSDAKSPKVRIVIQVQAAPGRQTALRWRIFANAEDLPELMLPLDKELLQPLQDRMRIYSQMSQRDADRLKQLVSGAERDVRATLSKQRANLESQSKLASRLTTIVAEAQLLNDLLRSQLTLYAKLRDGVDQDSPTLLQFGDPSEIKKVEEESASNSPAM